MTHYISFVIQNGPVHRNCSFLGMLPLQVSNSRTGFPILNSFSLPRWCRSTNAFLLCCSKSSYSKLAIRFSSNSHNVSSQIFSDSFSLRRSFTWILRLGIWNSIGITASIPNANRNGVVRMLVLYVVRYAHSVLCSFVSQSVRFSLTIFRRIFCKVLLVDRPLHWPAGSMVCYVCGPPHRRMSSFPLLGRGNALLDRL